MDQTDDAGNVNYFIKISFAKFSLFLKRETNCKSYATNFVFFYFIIKYCVKNTFIYFLFNMICQMDFPFIIWRFVHLSIF